MHKTWLTAPAVLIVAALVFAACREDSNTSEEPSQATSSKTAIAEAKATRQGLTQAVGIYSGGNDAAAAEEVTETYLQHFELVEGPLEEVDPELTEKLEDWIREDLIESMKAGDAVPDVTSLVDEIYAGLEDATRALRSS